MAGKNEKRDDVVRLGVAELERRMGVTRTTLWRWVKAGRFPAPHFVGEHRRWFLGDVEAWEREQMARTADARHGAKNLGEAARPRDDSTRSAA